MNIDLNFIKKINKYFQYMLSLNTNYFKKFLNMDENTDESTN